MMETVEKPTATGTTLKLISCLKGGIGNQLFQHVFAYSLAKKLGAEVLSDVRYFTSDPYGRQSVLGEIAPHAAITDLTQHIGTGSYMLLDGSFQSLQDSISLPADARVLALDGYWQSEHLLDRDVVSRTYGAIARSQRAVGHSDVARDIGLQDDAVAIHIRRSDYGHMGLCEPSYYIGAIDYLVKRFTSAKLYVFSDEPNFARNCLASRFPGIVPVASGSDIADLYLMSLCKHFVIANSTFSWWAAYFAEGKGGVIVSPKEWVTIPGAPSPLPARWVQVPGAVRPLQVDANATEAVAKLIQRSLFDDAIRQWFRDKGDQTLRVAFDHLDANSTVLDVGGYFGDWTHQIHSRYGSNVYVFEPIQQFADHIRQRFAGVHSVHVCQLGIGPRDETLGLQVSADGTSTFVNGNRIEQVAVREVNAFLAEQNIREIDLMKINIEGAEFDLLEHMVSTGTIARVARIQVQFHDFVPDAVNRREILVRKMSATHYCTWSYYFVWEEWIRKR